MCGIVAILRPTVPGESPAAGSLKRELALAVKGVPESVGSWDGLASALGGAAEQVDRLNTLLSRQSGMRALVASPGLREGLSEQCDVLEARLEALETRLDVEGAVLPPPQMEALNDVLVQLKDAAWALSRDRLEAARKVEALLDGKAHVAAIDAFTSIHMALAALDLMEVRGRDSAGLHLFVTGHDLDLDSAKIKKLLVPRQVDELFTSGAAGSPQGHLSLVYKAAAEIGELGDNVRVLRQALKEDSLLHLALASPGAQVTVLGHTRWASVGLINQANAHPLNQEELGERRGPYVVAALNGDVDNYADLIATDGLQVAEEITTDAKVIPVLVSRKLASGMALAPAFVETVSSFTGSVAIAAMTADQPQRLLLAQRGSGQALYVGLAEDAYVVASEPYGFVAQTSRYLRLDGETRGNPDNPTASQGHVVILDGCGAGTLAGIERFAYDGTPLPVGETDLRTTEITTRDVDRKSYPHYLLKEISEASRSLRKTLRGRIREENGEVRAVLGQESLPASLVERLKTGSIRRIIAIGQGTAAVAGEAVAAALSEVLGRQTPVEAMLATELSGFALEQDMSDTLLVAISQSGTTTDTNRTVDLVRARGGTVLAIVNRRHSDLAEKSDGVLYTSNGRDVEMSVASTKAFYAQIAAGFLLACALMRERFPGGAVAKHQGGGSSERSRIGDPSRVLGALRELPVAMEKVLGQQKRIAEIARRHAPRHRYWAVVGNGRNRIAAREIRIKLSELCYKSIACDATEDKKHIDLSSEPLILVCAAGLARSTADDVAKEVAIYRAHKATPIVIATEGENRFTSAVELITVPPTHPSLAFVLATVAGHLFGYEAALAIDALAHPLREARAAIESLVSEAQPGDHLLQALRPGLGLSHTQFSRRLRERAYDGHLEASTAVTLASLLNYVNGTTPLESYRAEHGRPGTPGVVVEDLTHALTVAIEELTRPIDAIKHQAKTVTVGISRSDEALLTIPLVRELMAAGVDRDRVGYGDLRALAALDPVVQKVLGHTRYRIDGDPEEDGCAAQVLDVGGISHRLPSRTEDNPILRGTKRMVALERKFLVARGRSDGRTVLLVPEVEGNRVLGLTLLHVLFHDYLPATALRGVLQGYRNRYAALRDAVMETEPSFREDLLETMPVVSLLTESIHTLAERWRSKGVAAPIETERAGAQGRR